jgi:hypothetical protein
VLVAQAAKQKDFEKILEILGSVPIEVDPKDFQNPPRMMTEAIAAPSANSQRFWKKSWKTAQAAKQKDFKKSWRYWAGTGAQKKKLTER